MLTANFDLSEFHSKDGVTIPEIYYPNVYELAQNLQVLRNFVKVPITINSAYRSPSHNNNIGGSPTSKHLKAQAADISTILSPELLQECIIYLQSRGSLKKGGLGIYNTFIHYDIGSSRSWDFRTEKRHLNALEGFIFNLLKLLYNDR